MKITVVDYGIGNLLSVVRGFQRIGCDVQLAAAGEEIVSASRLILPGVGAFGDGMEEIRRRNLEEPIREYAESGKPLLGICLGMQMLLERSFEFGSHNGLGLIPGSVIEIPKQTPAGNTHKTPHIGWSGINKDEVSWEDTFLQTTSPNSPVYFVHSYMAAPPIEYRLASCDYNGVSICAAVKNGNIYGTQFHPEKSGPIGLEMLEQFLTL
tara:strand:+ start:13092 stop:13721 length:630 start_codon:yes stop_codon:yes gene_type:complete